MIPKVIHYCWFGGNSLGENELACIESWRKYLPGYEIRRWDETNWNVRCCDYVAEAYDAKKWAFVSDYARLDILYREGGLYFDTDVELIRPIDDILKHGPFMGIETDFGSFSSSKSPEFELTVAPGLGLAANPGLDLYGALLASYEGDHFINEDGSFNTSTIVTRTTKILFEHGLKMRNGIQEVDGVTIYPADFFNPKDMWTGDIVITGNTRSIHHFSMSWLSEKDLFEHRVGKHLRKLGLSDSVVFKLSALLEIVRFFDVERFLNRFNFSFFKGANS